MAPPLRNIQEKLEIPIEALKGGEIRKAEPIQINLEKMKTMQMCSLQYCVNDETGEEIGRGGLGYFAIVDSKVVFYYAQGTDEEFKVESCVMIDTKEDIGKEKNVPVSFAVDAGEWKNVAYILCPSQSCEITVHAKIKCADSSKDIESERFTQEFYVPLYKTEDGFFFSVREFIKDNNIETYYYDSNPYIQKEIEYSIDAETIIR